ncbi:beta-galactosidase [Parasphingopyxis sp. CP4]|uniref:beta-galactosidase n=1 Tax=Parasphingopyxis sp. CP4 TaxID=2724527 RepID=UPI0015A0D3C1|nr:beta-galactosidase [Parasphingopyxis sp. CP4]QLC22010.1 beta-galactosidase [Parasphingopyxis sp. CP4]
MKLGCCYYPEHWPEEMWADDARRMKEAGLSLVRIGEFAWSRIEPEYGRLDWDWLDRAVETLGDAGLQIVMGTPTATPPKWLIDKRPDMVPVGADGLPRHFGSRRHYCFSHPGYREECRRIVAALARRYGEHPAVIAWQTDNEYGCHDTVRSYSMAAERRFREWLAERYGEIGALNAAWGNVFWSMEYRSFEAIDLPNATVTEPNPAHMLDYRRFASDEVVSFNALQTAILREHSPGRDIIHNYMGFFTDFDHHDVSKELDIATWDSYPLGFLEQAWFDRTEKDAYLRQGHPDFAAFHHDLYRGCTDGRWGVMEQQPGPVNWARFNPAPLPGMVRLWTLEAFAHGAEFVSYFRWRQAPFAQEQMHAGLLRPDSSEDVAIGEARQAAADLEILGEGGPSASKVALLFAYEAQWMLETQPQGRSFQYRELALNFYTALRKLGLDIDIVGPDAELGDYAMVLIPTLPIVPDGLIERLQALECPVLIGPRSGSKTGSFSIPETLAPGVLQDLLPLKVVRVESLRDGVREEGDGFSVSRWLEHVETDLTPEYALSDGRGIVYAEGSYRYLAAWPDARLLSVLVGRMAGEAGLKTIELPEGLRVRSSADHILAFNYSSAAIDIGPVETALGAGNRVSGLDLLEPAGVAIWKR